MVQWDTVADTKKVCQDPTLKSALELRSMQDPISSGMHLGLSHSFAFPDMHLGPHASD